MQWDSDQDLDKGLEACFRVGRASYSGLVDLVIIRAVAVAGSVRNAVHSFSAYYLLYVVICGAISRYKFHRG